ncbi:restriction endonuclease subunit S [Vibrio cholerae]
MSCNWSVKKLGDLVKFTSGGTPSKSNEAYWGGDIPWISASSMDSTRYSESELKVTTEGAKNGTRLVPKDTVLLLVRGGALHNKIPVGITTREVTFNQDVKALVPKTDEITPWYLLFWLISIKKTLLAKVENTGIGAGKLDTKILQELEVPLPPKPELQRLEKFCKALDDKIILNADTNQTLAQLAQAIFKSWFVDFDPVKAKMNGEQPEGMDAATASLFPEKLVESELGLIPEGWDAGTVGSVTAAKGGYAFKSKQFVDEGNPVIKIKNITSAGTVTTSDCQCVDDDIAKTASRFKLSDGDLLMAMTGATVGKSGIYVSDGRDGYLNQRVARFESKVDSTQPCWFTYNLVNKDSIFEQIVGAAQGSAQPNISSKGIEQVKTVIPTFDLISKYQELVAPLYTKWISNFRENSQLSELRDTLLPKLLSGDIELSAEL